MRNRMIINSLVCFLCISCIRSDGENLIQEINNDFLERIELSKKHIIMNVGDEILLCDIITGKFFSDYENTIIITHYPSNITVPEYNWMSSDPMVAEIRDNKLIGIFPGEALLIVKVKGLDEEAICSVTVLE
ncbi:MAG: hypothetical protein GX905_02350 [Bacteroidales bacterium]|nr:hypothetical protein [Bacteroidales bacterium]